jgi:RNA polymerase sigma-70 factor (ECF subfamily)
MTSPERDLELGQKNSRGVSESEPSRTLTGALAQKLDLLRSEPPAPAVPLPPCFDDLYDEYFSFTWRVLRHLGVQGAALHDAAQELWLVVHRQLPDYEARAAVRTWLFEIAINVARNQRRSERRRGGVEALPDQLRAPGGDPEALHVAREAWSAVQQFLDQLPEQDRIIFVCNLVERLPAAEAAQAAKIEVAVVYQRVRVLRRALKSWLEQG